MINVLLPLYKYSSPLEQGFYLLVIRTRKIVSVRGVRNVMQTTIVGLFLQCSMYKGRASNLEKVTTQPDVVHLLVQKQIINLTSQDILPFQILRLTA